ncbi:electron transfer flavoprotein subunit alpha/FixB family protein [Vreelandella nanhaiensis]|uniref:Electron transfer flavoprotein subunit alpha/FixB family protein n=1 Tax=Vreelandella nanhaiensis TaxID=1258546 RepID=A0A433KNQ9_9GAMM|nr:electron transfer flavoprotein subunit alpha/FixB family protein [Halomonas nanhaiensis]RUR31246.1 electron transfer flavoprotein subunit alpha/FixB family protein [Halomonas nanhaiensis]
MSELVRRDPRQEWIIRNRLHPQHLEALAQMGGAVANEWMGPNGVIRRNPHAVGFIGPNGIRRIDRSGVQQAAQAPGRSVEAKDARQRVTIETPAFMVAVVPDMAGGRLSTHDRDLLGLARQLADADPAQPGAVLAIVFGEHKETAFGEAGIDRLLHLEGERFSGYLPELRVATLQGVERDLAPRYWLLPDSTTGGGELGRRLAARLDERPAAQVWQVEADSESTTGWRCTARGAAGRDDVTRALPRVVLALAECADPVSETRHAAEAITLSQELPEVLGRIQDMGEVAVDPASVSLAEAEFILSAGNGVKDWDGYHHAAEVLGATKGASRVAVDDGYMPRDRQVGATGTWVSARVYVAVGISGAIQHLQGIQSCEKVVAVNLDEGCDMVKRADLAVIGDASQILAALVARVEQYRAEQQENRDAA